MKLLSILTAVCLIASLIASRQKTWMGIKKGVNMFIKLLPVLLLMLALISVVLFLIPNETLVKYMGEGSGVKGWITAALLGSVALIPGFIAYPLCGILIDNGVAYSEIAVFITTLMMTGFLTLPVEVKFFGWKVSVIRNLVSLADNETNRVIAGDCVVVPHQADSRSINAETDLEILAVQGLK